MTNIQEILEVISNPPAGVYAPSEDTFLMIDALSALFLREKEALDLGTGSAVLGLICAQMGARVTLVDIEDSALRNAEAAARKLNLTIKTAKSDIFSNITGRFDVVLFNPPYLPSNGIKDRAVDGGIRGRELIDRFLKELPLHLNENGFALLLVSSLNEPHLIIDDHPNLSFTVIATKNLFFEELQVLLCKLRNLTS